MPIASSRTSRWRCPRPRTPRKRGRRFSRSVRRSSRGAEMRPGEGLDALMSPRSIAIIGASQDATKIGGRPVELLRRYGYAGQVYPINPKASMVQGLQAYASLQAVPEAPDLAIVAVDAEKAPEAVEQFADRGVRSVVVFSSGFAELGEKGRAMQERLRAAAH